jgi:Ca2+-dependent lipid-binding protein
MPPLDLTTNEIDAYVKLRYSGISLKSSVVTSRNPIFNEQLNLASMLPNRSKFINVEVYDEDKISNDDLVGTFKIPFHDI